ncbi:hypothetical protein [Streptomyces griseoviridis]|uniref:hypothetical protein n=1 Tax=Streptomyces griseoviridis TaxID=45398 RepID=UPI003F578283
MGDPLVGPDAGLRLGSGQQLDVGGRVEGGHHLLGDSDVQRGPQGVADMRLGVEAGDAPERRHGIELRLQPLATGPVLRTLPWRHLEFVANRAPLGVLLLDLDVALVDRVEHRVDVVHAELVQPQVAQMRLEVDADIALVARRPASTQAFASGKPGIEPLGNVGLGVEGLPGLEAATRLVVVRKRLLLLEAALDEVADLVLPQASSSSGMAMRARTLSNSSWALAELSKPPRRNRRRRPS